MCNCMRVHMQLGWQLTARVHVLQPKLGDNTPPQLPMQLSATVMTTLFGS